MIHNSLVNKKYFWVFSSLSFTVLNILLVCFLALRYSIVAWLSWCRNMPSFLVKWEIMVLLSIRQEFKENMRTWTCNFLFIHCIYLFAFHICKNIFLLPSMWAFLWSFKEALKAVGLLADRGWYLFGKVNIAAIKSVFWKKGELKDWQCRFYTWLGHRFYE